MTKKEKIVSDLGTFFEYAIAILFWISIAVLIVAVLGNAVSTVLGNQQLATIFDAIIPISGFAAFTLFAIQLMTTMWEIIKGLPNK